MQSSCSSVLPPHTAPHNQLQCKELGYYRRPTSYLLVYLTDWQHWGAGNLIRNFRSVCVKCYWSKTQDNALSDWFLLLLKWFLFLTKRKVVSGYRKWLRKRMSIYVEAGFSQNHTGHDPGFLMLPTRKSPLTGNGLLFGGLV